MKKGTITFLPADGKGPTAAAPIADGKYSVKVAPDEKLVKIEGYKVDWPAPLQPLTIREWSIDQEQILPARYNTKSELTREITSGDRTCDFALEKSPAAAANAARRYRPPSSPSLQLERKPS